MRRFNGLPLLFVVTVWLSASVGLAEPDIRDTRLLTQPAVSGQHVAFVYADNLWVADLDGKNVRRLTSDLDGVSNPVFSPDGSVIAFSAEYEGNVDVYVVSVAGGPSRRLTGTRRPTSFAALRPMASRCCLSRRGTPSRRAMRSCSPCR